MSDKSFRFLPFCLSAKVSASASASAASASASASAYLLLPQSRALAAGEQPGRMKSALVFSKSFRFCPSAFRQKFPLLLQLHLLLLFLLLLQLLLHLSHSSTRHQLPPGSVQGDFSRRPDPHTSPGLLPPDLLTTLSGCRSFFFKHRERRGKERKGEREEKRERERKRKKREKERKTETEKKGRREREKEKERERKCLVSSPRLAYSALSGLPAARLACRSFRLRAFQACCRSFSLPPDFLPPFQVCCRLSGLPLFSLFKLREKEKKREREEKKEREREKEKKERKRERQKQRKREEEKERKRKKERGLVRCRGTSHSDPIPTHPQAASALSGSHVTSCLPFFQAPRHSGLLPLFQLPARLLTALSGLLPPFRLATLFLFQALTTFSTALSGSTFSQERGYQRAQRLGHSTEFAPRHPGAWFGAGGLPMQTRSLHIPRLAYSKFHFLAFFCFGERLKLLELPWVARKSSPPRRRGTQSCRISGQFFLGSNCVEFNNDMQTSFP